MSTLVLATILLALGTAILALGAYTLVRRPSPPSPLVTQPLPLSSGSWFFTEPE